VNVAVVLATKLEVIFFTTPQRWNDTWMRGSARYSSANMVAVPVVDRDTIAKWIIENVT
jgi:hypothetical protein